jgi:hypothetical protein
MNNVSPQATFDVTGTGKFSGVLTLGSTISNGTYTYTLPSATGTLALVGGSGVGTVTSVAALTLGTSGTDLSSTVANGTTTPVITLNVPTASATNRGALSAADWTTFNNKQNALTNPVTGTGTSGTIPVFTGSTTIGNSIIQSNATQVNVVGNGSQLLFDSLGQTKSGGIQYTNDFELLINNSRGTGSAIFLGNNNLDFNTNTSGNPRIRITSGGNVLINTTTDAGFKLDVNGTGRFSDTLTSEVTGAINTIFNSTNASGGYIGFRRSGTSIGYLGNSAQLGIGTLDALELRADNNLFLTTTSGTLSILSGGNVGIGTTSPGQRLSVFQDTNGDARLTLSNPNTGVSARTFLYTVTTGNRYVGMLAYGANATGTTVGLSNASLGILEAGGDISNFLINSTNPMVFGVNGSERMRITSSGNVGIGTITPPSRLSVQWDKSTAFSGLGVYDSQAFNVSNHGGTVTFGGTFNSGGSYTEWSAIGGMKSNTTDGNISGDINFYTRLNSSAMTERMRITSGGNLMIGTTSDNGFKLDVIGPLKWGDSTTYAYSGADNTGMFIETVGTTTATRVLRIQGINNAGTSYSSIRLEAGISEIAFLTSNSERMRINSTGNVTINGSGNTLLVSSNNNSLSIGVGFQGVTSGYIGGISSALYGYSTNGGYVLLNASSVWVAASDVKRKRNFESYELGLNAIIGLKPKLYNMDFQEDGDEKQVGLVAQEVREFIPLAYEENNDFIGLNYNAIIVTMVKAIQQQQEQIQELKNKLS